MTLATFRSKIIHKNGLIELMRIITKRTLKEFYKKHPDAKSHLDTWYDLVKKAQWNSWTDIKKLFPKSSPVKNNRVIFNIAGNKE